MFHIPPSTVTDPLSRIACFLVLHISMSVDEMACCWGTDRAASATAASRRAMATGAAVRLHCERIGGLICFEGCLLSIWES
jgi:hypothetical protein